jgi:hypothetical protein
VRSPPGTSHAQLGFLITEQAVSRECAELMRGSIAAYGGPGTPVMPTCCGSASTAPLAPDTQIVRAARVNTARSPAAALLLSAEARPSSRLLDGWAYHLCEVPAVPAGAQGVAMEGS